MVGEAGVEPAWPCGQRILSPSDTTPNQLQTQDLQNIDPLLSTPVSTLTPEKTPSNPLDGVLDAIRELTPEQRAALAEMLNLKNLMKIIITVDKNLTHPVCLKSHEKNTQQPSNP